MKDSPKIGNNLLQVPVTVVYVWHILVAHSFHTHNGPRDLGRLIACWIVCLVAATWFIQALPEPWYIFTWLPGAILLLVIISLSWSRRQYKKLFRGTPPLCDEPSQIAERQDKISKIVTAYRTYYAHHRERAKRAKARRVRLIAIIFRLDTENKVP